jgi:DNA polymerase V
MNAKLLTLKFYRASDLFSVEIPLIRQGIVAGFPSPAEDYLECSLDLNELMIKDKESTFYGRVQGDSMQDALIFEGDILVIDRSLTPKNGCIALCQLDGEFTVKTLEIGEKQVTLVPANKEFKDIVVTEDREFSVWGVVTFVIHKTW